MKKQITPPIRTHLLRGTVILLSLVAFNHDIFCQTPTPTPSPSASCSRPVPGACVSYEAESEDNTLQGSAIVLSCPTCSSGAKVSYVGSNDGTLEFDFVAVVATGNYTVTICYLNGDAVRYAYLSVNGGLGMPVTFPSTGSFETLGSIQITVTLNTGCNTLKFYNPIVGSWAPDFDRITFNCPTCAVPSCDTGIIQNGGFETGTLPPWVIDGTDGPPFVTNTHSHSGTYSAVAGGTSDGNPICGSGAEPSGDSSFYQQFVVPSGTSTLSFWHDNCTSDSIVFDWQDAYITDINGQILQTIFHVCNNTNGFVNTEVNITQYAGQTVRIKFLVHQDSVGDLTAMYVDDVVLRCGTPSPTPTPTSSPTPTPEGCYPNFTTAEGCDALLSLTSGSGNTGLGWRALVVNTIGNFNTGVGGGALALNTMDSNTAVGAATLLLNSRGTQNTAVGTNALLFNGSGDVSGDFNTATGYSALMNNLTGGSNTAIGWEALAANVEAVNNVALGSLSLSSNTSGDNNTTIGSLALENCVSTSRHVVLGTGAGSGITIADYNIIVGHHSGVHSRFGQENNVCYIGNIYGVNVDDSNGISRIVLVDPDGRLGTVRVAAGGSPGKPSPKELQPQAIPDATNQAMVNLEVQSLEATISQQQNQIQMLTAQIKEQAAQIQKVNARLEMSNATATIIVNKPEAVP